MKKIDNANRILIEKYINTIDAMSYIASIDIDKDSTKNIEKLEEESKNFGNDRKYEVNKEAQRLLFLKLFNIAKRIDLRSLHQFQVFNILPYLRSEVIMVDLIIPSMNINIYTTEGQRVEFEIIRLSPLDNNEILATALIDIKDLQPLGYETYTVEEEDKKIEITNLYSEENFIENDLFKVMLKDNEIEVTYKAEDLVKRYDARDFKIISTLKSALMNQIILLDEKTNNKYFFSLKKYSENLEIKFKGKLKEESLLREIEKDREIIQSDYLYTLDEEYFYIYKSLKDKDYLIERNKNEINTPFVVMQERLMSRKNTINDNVRFKRNIPIKKSFLEIKTKHMELDYFKVDENLKNIYFKVTNKSSERVRMMLQSYFESIVVSESFKEIKDEDSFYLDLKHRKYSDPDSIF